MDERISAGIAPPFLNCMLRLIKWAWSPLVKTICHWMVEKVQLVPWPVESSAQLRWENSPIIKYHYEDLSGLQRRMCNIYFFRFQSTS